MGEKISTEDKVGVGFFLLLLMNFVFWLAYIMMESALNGDGIFSLLVFIK